MVKWFGKHWGAAICNETPHVETPTGQLCEWCSEQIALEDDGIIIPVHEKRGRRDGAWHYECHIRQIIGGVLHQLKACSCYVKGGPQDADPSELTRREAARFAVELWEKNNRK